MALNFAAQVGKFATATKARATALVRESAERLQDEMQRPVAAGGNMPIDTGFLRASFNATLNTLPGGPLEQNPGTGTFTYDPAAASLVIAGLEPGKTLYFSYSAAYAPHVEYGANGRPGRRFVGLAAQQWPAIVNQVAAEIQSRLAR